MNPLMTIMQGCKSKDVSKQVSLEMFIDMLKSDGMHRKITAYRAETDEAKRKRMKESLPAVVPSGILSDRSNLEVFSGMMCLDFDHIGLEKANEIKESEFMPSWVVLAFVSPSGDGLKVFVRMYGEEEMENAFTKASRKFMQLFGIESDKNCKGAVRLCFASYDNEPYFNLEAARIWFEQGEIKAVQNFVEKTTGGEKERETTPEYYNELTMVKPVAENLKMTAWEVIQATQPAEQGERTGKLKLLARGLKLNAGISDPAELVKYVLEWVNMCGDRITTKEPDENLSTFRTFYAFANKPLDAIRSDELKAFQRAEAGIMPEECALFSSDTRRMLCAWMWNLRGADGKFFLSCKTVAKRMNVSSMAAWNWILDIEFHGIIRRDTIGHTGKASGYTWLGRKS